MRSLNARVTASAAVVLAAFLLLTATGLDRAIRNSARAAQQERLLGSVYLLMGEAELRSPGELEMPAEPVVPEWSQPGSGRYAWVLNEEGRVLWRSASTAGGPDPEGEPLPPGRRRFFETRSDSVPDDAGLFVQGFGVRWKRPGDPVGLSFYVASDRSAYRREAAAFRRTLWTWLGLTAGLLVLVLTIVLRWGLRPLRRLAGEVAAVEKGAQERILGTYPTEVYGLTTAINTLLLQERSRQTRYRNALGDLAHSLKTPLAVLRTAASTGPETPDGAAVEDAVDRMDRIVQYQLQRAATAGRSTAARPVALEPIVERLARTMTKVYRDRAIDLETNVDASLGVRADEGDLTEMLGNLLDNAFKWARHRVGVCAEKEGAGVRIRVDDDGPGLPSADAGRLLERGVRADRSAPGHGLGLAMVRDIVEAYEGELSIDCNDAGGTRVTVRLPA